MYIVHCTQSYTCTCNTDVHVCPSSITEVWGHAVQGQLFAGLHVHEPVHVVYNIGGECVMYMYNWHSYVCTARVD